MSVAEGWTPDEIAAHVAADLSDGTVVNLGIGMPTLVADHLVGREVIVHSENGLIGIGGVAPPEQIDWDLIDAGKRPVTLVAGAAIVHQADSFALIRGGHLDVAVLGSYEVSCTGDLANWSADDDRVPPAVGGAMDLAAGAKAVYAMMRHANRQGRPKIVERCSLPLTAAGVVRRIYTDLAILDVAEEGLFVRTTAPGIDVARLRALTGGPLRFISESAGTTPARDR